MRTTLTLDSDVALRLTEKIKVTRKPMKEIINEALRIGLNAPQSTPSKRFVVKPHALGLRPGIDPDKLNQLMDEMEVQDFLTKQTP
jgi:hypothetical protein